MLSIWQRIQNRVLQNLTATYFRGLCLTHTGAISTRPSACYAGQHLFAATTASTWQGEWPLVVVSFLKNASGSCENAVGVGAPLFVSRNNQCSQKVRKVGLRGMHSSVEDLKMGCMKVKILPALEDNYMYLIVCDATKEAAVVDPVDPECVLNAVKQENVNLTKVLTTHHHWDHAGGNEKLLKMAQKSLQVYGGDERIGGLNCKVTQDDCISIGNLKVTCIFTPCHTTGHICYYVQAPNGDNVVFTGDTLFQGGCGRFFEGTAEQMYTALVGKLSALPDDTKVFCGHEYTLQNMAYARHVEPTNDNVLQRIEWAKLRRATQSPTVPSTIAEEKSWNPFMRVHCPDVQKHSKETDPIRTMGSLRKEKDNFKA